VCRKKKGNQRERDDRRMERRIATREYLAVAAEKKEKKERTYIHDKCRENKSESDAERESRERERERRA